MTERKPLTTFLSADEKAIISDGARGQGESLSLFLRKSALIRARREENLI